MSCPINFPKTPSSDRNLAHTTALYLTIVGLVACQPPWDKSNTAVIALEYDIGGFNELVSADNSTTQQVIERLYLDLFEEDPDSSQRPPQFGPRLALSHQASDNGKAVTLHLRPDAVWSDGTPISAEDVRWTWQVQTDPAVAWEYADIKAAIEEVEVVDPQTVRFHFTHSYANQLADINEGVILPRHAWSQLPLDRWREGEDWFRKHLVVSGPYQVEHYAPGSELVLVANDRYFEADLPTIPRLLFQVVPDSTSRVRSLLAGELDFIPKLRAHEATQIEASDAAQVIAYPHRQYDYIAWNLNDELFRSTAVRLGLLLAIDRQQIIDTLLSGYATIANSPIVSNVWAHTELEPWPHAPQAAVNSFAQAGWQQDNEGILRDEDGQPFAFELAFNASNTFRRDAAAMIQEQLRAIGAQVTLRPEEFNVLSDKLENGQHQAYLGAFNMDTTLDLTVIFHSSAVEDGYNFSRYANHELDRLIERVKTYPNIQDAKSDLARIQEILHHDQPMAFLWEPMRLNAHSNRLQNVVPNLIDTYANLRHWSLASTSPTP